MSPWDRAAILEQAQAWYDQGLKVWLFHVLDTWGSSPRPAGSLMAMNHLGEQAGSVSGGCVEANLATRIDELPVEACALFGYEPQTSPVQLPCGSGLQLLVERVGANTLSPLLTAYSSNKAIRRCIDSHTGNISIGECTEATADFAWDGTTLCAPYGLQWRLLIIGAEHLSAQVARIALSLEYQVLVCEPRCEKHSTWHQAHTTLLSCMPDDAVRKYADGHTAVLALSHDPKLDDMALMEALTGPAFYVGALGSQRSSQRRRENLRAMGVDETQLQRLDAPIGIDIGSRSAAEIAISIAAGLVQVRSRMREQRP